MTTPTEATKTAYVAPQLVEYGNMETLTQGGHGHFDRGGTKGNGFGFGHCKHAGLNPGHADDPLGFCS